MLLNRQRFTDLSRLRLNLRLDGFTSEVLNWGLYSGDDWWRNYLHVHSFYEICYVFCGEGEFRIDDQRLRVGPGDLFIARPDERHEIISAQEAPLGIYFWSYTLVPATPLKPTDLNRLFDAFASGKQSICHEQYRIARVLESLTSEIAAQGIGFAAIIEGLVKQLLIETARAATEIAPIAPPLSRAHHDTVTQTIVRYLQDNYRQTLSLKEIAAQVHLSERHMSRLFKAATSLSIKQYVIQLKMDTAKQLLLNQDMSVSDIAYEVGYHDVRHFSTAFRHYTGVSPTHYRERGGTRFIHAE
jgi:AraC-like DNA-binding protein